MHWWTHSDIISSVYSGLQYPVSSAKDRGPVGWLFESRYERPSKCIPKTASLWRAENDFLKEKLQFGLLENLSVETHFARIFVRWRSPAHDMLLSTATPVPRVRAVSAAIADVRA